jgi:hypothetical protein
MRVQVSAVGGFADLAYKVAGGETKRMPWDDVDPHAVAEGLPWRQFPWYLGLAAVGKTR